jgi:hypothetical protein
MELRAALNDSFQLDLPATLTFDHPTISALSSFIASQLSGALLATADVGKSGAMQAAALQIANDASAQGCSIALVACNARYPCSAGSSDREGFWRTTEGCVNVQSLVPLQRWDIDLLYSPSQDSSGTRMYVRHGAFLSEVDAFDAFLFR